MSKYLVLRKPRGQIHAQVFIGGSQPFTDGVLKLQLVDANLQDAPFKVLAETHVVVAARPANDWVSVTLEFDWPTKEAFGDFEFDLASMELRAEINTPKSRSPLYITKVSHPIDLKNSKSFVWTPTVVVQEV